MTLFLPRYPTVLMSNIRSACNAETHASLHPRQPSTSRTLCTYTTIHLRGQGSTAARLYRPRRAGPTPLTFRNPANIVFSATRPLSGAARAITSSTPDTRTDVLQARRHKQHRAETCLPAKLAGAAGGDVGSACGNGDAVATQCTTLCVVARGGQGRRAGRAGENRAQPRRDADRARAPSGSSREELGDDMDHDIESCRCRDRVFTFVLCYQAYKVKVGRRNISAVL